MAEPPRPDRGLGWVLVGVGTHFTAMIIVGFMLGFAVDYWLGSAPLFMLLLGVLGFVGGLIKAHRVLNRLG